MDAVELDHLILAVNDIGASVRFYTDLVGFSLDEDRPPFTVVRVNDALTLQLAPWGTGGGEHLAFAMAGREFEAALARIRGAGAPSGVSAERCTCSTPTVTSSNCAATTPDHGGVEAPARKG